MNYEEMSDFEVNSYVSMYIHGFSWIEFDDEFHGHVKCGNERSPGFAMVEVSDYCNNPSDAWPIILDSKITVRPWNHDEWQSFTMDGYDYDFMAWHENPLRAAMISFLMMSEK